MDEAKKTSRRGRSPGYPSIDLRAALDKATAIYRAESHHDVGFPTLMQHMGYSMKSSGGRLAFASLKKFGLIEVTSGGGGTMRSAHITQLGKKLILDTRPDSQERKLALQEAALRPAIHRTLWARYGGTLPSDANLLYQLQMSDGFTDTGAKDFLAQFRRTLAFAGVDSSTTISGSADPDDDDAHDGEDLMTSAEPTPAPSGVGLAKIGAALAATGPRLEFPLSGGNVLELRLRSRVSKSEFEKIKKLLDLVEDSLVEPSEA